MKALMKQKIITKGMYSYGIINPAPTKKRSSSATSMILEID
jgi:hypothetical protein